MTVAQFQREKLQAGSELQSLSRKLSDLEKQLAVRSKVSIFEFFFFAFSVTLFYSFRRFIVFAWRRESRQTVRAT